MSIHRYAARVDKTQASIVEALRMCGFHVELIRKPVDLAVRHPSWPANRWMFAEAKTPKGKKQVVYERPDRKKQTEFCKEHSIPFWTSPDQALRELYAISNTEPNS